MKALVVYESMYGNTHHVATAIGDGLGTDAEVIVVPVSRASATLVDAADLLVVGGPTHAHGMSRPSTRNAAAEAAEKPEHELALEPDATGEGLREWLAGLSPRARRAAAFDTRMHGPVALTGHASKGIAKQLRKHGASLVADPESFIVTKHNQLEEDEARRAHAWGAELAASMSRSETDAGGTS